MEVIKCFKLELHFNDPILLDVFEESRKLASVSYHLMKNYGYMFIVEGNTSKYPPRKVAKLIKEIYLPQRKLDLRLDFIEWQIQKIWESFVGTWKAWKKMPSPKIIETLGDVLRVRVSKGKYKRNLTIREGDTYREVILQIVKKQPIKAVVYFPKELEQLELGDPAELVRYGDRVFLHLPIKKQVEFPKQIERVVGIDLGFSKYFLVAVALDKKRGQILDVLKIPASELQFIWETFDEIQQLKSKMRPKFGRTKAQWKSFMKRIMRETYKQMRSSQEIQLPYSVFHIIHWKKPKRGSKGKRKNSVILPRDELGRSLWKDQVNDFLYYCVNRVVAFAERNHCQMILHENLRTLKKKVWQLHREYSQLGKQFQKTRDKKLLRERLKLKKHLKRLSWFPYGRFFEDLQTEANWNGILTRWISPYGTSITCPRCGYKDPRNRVSRDEFQCQQCGYNEEADFVSAWNIARK